MKSITLKLSILAITLTALASSAGACPNGPKGARCYDSQKSSILTKEQVRRRGARRIDLVEHLRDHLPSRLRRGSRRSIVALVARLELTRAATAESRLFTVRVHFKHPVRRMVACCQAIHCKCPPFVEQHYAEINFFHKAPGRYQLSIPGFAPLYVDVP